MYTFIRTRKSLSGGGGVDQWVVILIFSVIRVLQYTTQHTTGDYATVYPTTSVRLKISNAPHIALIVH